MKIDTKKNKLIISITILLVISFSLIYIVNKEKWRRKTGDLPRNLPNIPELENSKIYNLLEDEKINTSINICSNLNKINETEDCYFLAGKFFVKNNLEVDFEKLSNISKNMGRKYRYHFYKGLTSGIGNQHYENKLNLTNAINICKKFDKKYRNLCFHGLTGYHCSKPTRNAKKIISEIEILGEPFLRGCFGVMSYTYTRNYGLESAKNKCKDLSENYHKTYIFTCFHGVGSYISKLSKNLNEAVEKCKNVNKKYRSECFFALGYYMENVPEICGKIEKNYKKPCYRGFSHQIGDEYSNLQKALTQCKKISSDYRSICYKSTMHHILERNLYNLTKARIKCREIDKRYKNSCFKSLGHHSVDVYLINKSKVLNFVSRLEEGNKEIFFQGFQNKINGIPENKTPEFEKCKKIEGFPEKFCEGLFEIGS